MLRLQYFSSPQTLPNPKFSRKKITDFPSPLVRTPKTPSNFSLRAKNGGDGGLSKDPGGQNEERKANGSPIKDGGGEADPKRDWWPAFNFRWGDLLNPDPDNIVAVGLTGLLTWASVQVLWQLFFISINIVVAAFKYSFIAALLIFILITLL